MKRTRNWNKSAEGKAWAKAYYKKYMTMRQEQNREYLDSVRRNSKCIDCGETNPVLLQFHHRDGTKKKYPIGMYTRWGLWRLKMEIDRCDVLCANCHIMRHHNEQSGYNAQRKK